MKKAEKDSARILRHRGYSMNQIVSELGVAKSSVSLWVRDIELSDTHRAGLSARGRSVESIERRRISRLANERARRSIVFKAAAESILSFTEEQIFLIGLGLYWGEGSKTSRGSASFFNSDPRSIQIMMRFYKEIGEVPDLKFRGHIFLHPHLDSSKAEEYWSKISGIPLSQFNKTTMQHNRASKGKKDSLPLGTFAITVHDTNLYLRIMGWLEGIYVKAVPERDQVPCRFHAHL